MPPPAAVYLRTIRLQRGLSQEELALASEVPQNTISRLETNRNARPTYSTVIALARALTIGPDQLRFGPDPRANNATSRRRRPHAEVTP
jgi:transcriptional regulator with XRE-family HTH domain